MTQLSTVGLRIADVDLVLVGPDAIVQLVERAWPTFVTSEHKGLRINIDLHEEQRTLSSQPTFSQHGEGFVLQDSGLMRLEVSPTQRAAQLDMWLDPTDPARQLLPTGLHNALTGLLASLLARSRGFLLHASAITLDNDHAVIFTGRSGAGKSTIAGMYPSADVLNDEFIGLRRLGDRWLAHATPLSGTLRLMPVRRAVPVVACMALEQASTPLVTPLRRADSLRHLLASVALPSGDIEGEGLAFAVACEFIEHGSFATLRFTKDDAATRALVAQSVGGSRA